MGQICGAQLAQTANIHKIIYRKANFQGGYRVQTQQTQQMRTPKRAKITYFYLNLWGEFVTQTKQN